MTFVKGKAYYDAIGRVWHVLCKNTLLDGTTVLTVARWMVGGPNIYAHAVEDDEIRATVLLDDGFTTIYSDDEVIE